MTLDDVIVKTGLLLGTMVVTGGAAWVLDVGLGVIALAGIVGFVLAMVNIFKKQVSPPLVMAYAAAQGVFVGAISHVYADRLRRRHRRAGRARHDARSSPPSSSATGPAGCAPPRSSRRSSRFGLLGMVGLVVLNMLFGLFGDGDALGIRGENLGLSVLVSVGLIVFGALTFVMDFDQADRMVAAGVPEKESWRVAFGLVVGLVFLYLEILRLLSYFQGRD